MEGKGKSGREGRKEEGEIIMSFLHDGKENCKFKGCRQNL